METPVSSDKVLVCLTCGDKGYTNAFIYCVKCLGFVIHRYCLDVLPKTSDEFVSWFCDDCKPPLPYQFTSPPEHDPPQFHEEDPPSLAHLKTNHPRKKRNKKPLKKRKIDPLVEAGKDNERVSVLNRLNRCVVLGLERPEDKSLQSQKEFSTSLQHAETSKGKVKISTQSNCQNSVESILKEASMNSDSGANQITPQSAELDNNCVAVKANKHKTEKAIEHSSCESSCTDVTSKNEEDITLTEEGLRWRGCEPDDDKLVSNSSSSAKESNERSKELYGNAYTSQTAYSESNIQAVHYQLATPVLDPVWRGSFNITQTDYELFEGFVGHLSRSACAQAREEATTLPSLLSLEMDSRAHLWPRSFSDSMPTGENIALYFFPGDTKIERDFELLVIDMIDGDLAMKTRSKNAELLIFTSKVLPRSYWRFQGNYYLWGVFKGKLNNVPVPNHGDNHSSSANPASEVESETLKRMRTVESHSPQSPLCNYR